MKTAIARASSGTGLSFFSLKKVAIIHRDFVVLLGLADAFTVSM